MSKPVSAPAVSASAVSPPTRAAEPSGASVAPAPSVATMAMKPPKASVAMTAMITASIDGVPVRVPKGTLVIRAAERMGVEIPRFCDHPLLDPVAACRMCLVEIDGFPKPQPGCAVPLTEGMVVRTQLTSQVADKAQHGVMEFLLVNHPLDCPVCDKGGECPLQNQAMTHGRGETRFGGVKRTFPKPIPISAQILLDRERCVSCTRCTRFADEIAGDPLIDLLERGSEQQIGIGEGQPFDSYFSGNTIQICPVGALTSSDYRFKSRPFDLVSAPTICEHCAAGCQLRTDVRHNSVQRRLAGTDYEVNEEWNCDKGRFAFGYAETDRITEPLIRRDGQLRPAAWPEAIAYAAAHLRDARGSAAVFPGGRLTREDAYAYAKFARVALGSDDIDFRARPGSEEEADFLAAIAGSGPGATYADLDQASIVLLVGLEPEEESPILFLRLRKAATKQGVMVVAISSWASSGFRKAPAAVLAAVPGQEAAVLRLVAASGSGEIDADSGRAAGAGLEPGHPGLGAPSQAAPGQDGLIRDVAVALRQPGAVILAGERLAGSPGGFTAVVELARQTGARLAWVPRRAGERGALDAGALAGSLPGGGSLTNSEDRANLAEAWGIDAATLPATVGRSLDQLVAAVRGSHFAGAPAADPEGVASAAVDPAAAGGTSGAADAAASAAPGASVTGAASAAADPVAVAAVVVAGVDPADLADPAGFIELLDQSDFVLSLETRHTAVTERADVVLPVAVDTERAGSYVNWEGRVRSFGKVMRHAHAMTDGRVLALIADELDTPIGYGDPASLGAELDRLPRRPESRPDFPTMVTGPVEQAPAPIPVPVPAPGEAWLATWRQLLDLGTLQAVEKGLAGTRRAAVARMSGATAATIGATNGSMVVVSTDSGSLRLPLAVTDMPDAVVWVPTNSPESVVYGTLGVGAGQIVRIAAGGES